MIALARQGLLELLESGAYWGPLGPLGANNWQA